MNDTNPITKEDLIATISAALEKVRPEFNDNTYKSVVEFATELQHQIEIL